VYVCVCVTPNNNSDEELVAWFVSPEEATGAPESDGKKEAVAIT
jgi:hypothetical protein